MSTTKEKIVDLAREYIQRVGYPLFNYKQIALELNIKNAAVHHYFPAKEDLGLAVVEKDREDFHQLVKQLANASPTEKAESMLQMYRQYFYNGTGGFGNKLCIISTYGSAYASIPLKMQQGASVYLNEIVQWLNATFEEGRQLNELQFEGEPEDITNLWVNNLPGSLLQGRILGPEFFDRAINLLRLSIKKA
jgi:TetR/AcrR family transcriptional repressor of nem operon